VRLYVLIGKIIKRVTKTITNDKYLICIEKDAIANNIPSQRTIISPNHKLLYKKKMCKAKELFNVVTGVNKVKYTGEVLYNILLEEHDKMMVNNLICETLSPINSIVGIYKLLDLVPIEKQSEVILQINKDIKNHKKYFSIKL
jgi:hypothetical protein